MENQNSWLNVYFGISLSVLAKFLFVSKEFVFMVEQVSTNVTKRKQGYMNYPSFLPYDIEAEMPEPL